VVALGAGSSAAAATFTASDGASLSAAVQRADAQSTPSTIELGVDTYAPTGTLTIRGDLTIVGPSVRGETISGAGEAPGSDLFDVLAGAHATFVNVSLAAAGYENQGAAIDDSGAVELDNSTLAGNDGPSLLVEPDATAAVRDSTLSWGLETGIVDHGSVTLVNSTVADNEALGVDDRGAVLTLVNTIVADNGVHDCTAPARSVDHSLDSDGTCGVGALGGVDPGLGELLWNGGPTSTQALAAGSPAIGAGDVGQCPSFDQRYLSRPAGSCDIGAYQTDAGPAVADPPSGTVPGQGEAGSAPSGSSGPSSTTGSSPRARRRLTGVAGRGTLRGSRRRPSISFALSARLSRPHGSVTYRDPAAHVWLRGARISAVTVDGAHGVVTATGSAVNTISRHRVHFVVTTTQQGRVATLRVRLSTGYNGGGRLASGTLADTTTAVSGGG